MNFRGVNDFREKRNQFINMPYSQMHYSIASYCTEHSKDEMKVCFGDDFLNNLPIVPDPLRKNLADTIITAEAPKKARSKSFLEDNNIGASMGMEHTIVQETEDRSESSFSSITNFISGVFNVISGAMFHRRTKSTEDQHYEVFNYADERKRSPDDDWQTSKIEDQNINERAHERNGEKEVQKTMDINNDYQTTVESCEVKLNQVRNLLNKQPVQNISRYRPRRPRKQFVDVGSYGEEYEDAFTTEDFISHLAGNPIIEYVCPLSCQNGEFVEIDAAITKTYTAPDNKDMLKPHIVEPVEKCDTTQKEGKNCATNSITEKGCNIVDSCTDKLSQLKALLEEKKKNRVVSNIVTEDKSMPLSEPKKIQKVEHTPKIHNKHYKNHHRTTNKRQKMNLQKNIQEDLLFANEIDPDGLLSVEDSSPIKSDTEHMSETPSSDQTYYFDEVKGRFRNSSTTESDDSFQIVFSEAPPCRSRKVSECDSEDSFIIFDDSPESCYVSTDVFGDNPSDTEPEYSDSDSEVSDSGCGVSNFKCKLSPYLSRTISDLTDDSLYEEAPKDVDQVDCAFRSVAELPNQAVDSVTTSKSNDPKEKKIPKKVHFSPNPPKVHVMRVWAFAARQARAGHWERHALDRERFKRRIADVEMALSWVLKPQHRSRVLFQRIMPWRNAQRRKEIAEKKEQDRKRKEMEALEEERRCEEMKAQEEERKRKEIEEETTAKVNEDLTEVRANVVDDSESLVENGLTVDGESNNDTIVIEGEHLNTPKLDNNNTDTEIKIDQSGLQIKDDKDNCNIDKNIATPMPGNEIKSTEMVKAVALKLIRAMKTSVEPNKHKTDEILKLNSTSLHNGSIVSKENPTVTNVNTNIIINDGNTDFCAELNKLPLKTNDIKVICDKLADLNITEGLGTAT